MALLLAQPNNVIPLWEPLAHAVNRWLWRWSPWHLRFSFEALEDSYRRCRATLARRDREACEMEAWIERSDPLPLVPIHEPAAVLSEDEPGARRARRFTIAAKQYTFVAQGLDFEFACGHSALAEMMADRYVRRFTRDLRDRITAELKAFAKC